MIKILMDAGFEKQRQKGSHRTYKGLVKGEVRIVQVSGHGKAEVARENLGSIIRQSGLWKKLFR